ncbi:S-4TM family putative pore-forming effector [Planosporangium flavigriseum]|uniref:Uncharacterized protein n=1 Tax=Planosporangium flavigriseum TaxID=373681 RepID=A0A8J3LKR1_9ACTN|nr:S-4TM family putative pore-forming effector [Planosporangium flavigriseum]GIG73184.1 hypothetical protein Pfl04_15880 [Planosporangium flavigriseum]
MTGRLTAESLAPPDGVDQNAARYAIREIQDGIFLVRLSATRVPYLLYALFRRRDEGDFDRATPSDMFG